MKANIFLQLRHLLLGSLLVGHASTLPAQKVCQETAVYFASGKSSLTPQATQRLDSLIALWGDREVHLELEGHTDSINPASVNLQLSEDRIAVVNHYLTQYSKASLSTQLYAQGENDPCDNNGSEQGKANNRRVEIKYVLLQDGNFTFSGQQGSTMRLPASAITSCRLCETDFSLDYYGTDEEIAAAGIDMWTTNGERLTTCGMVIPKTSCMELNQRPRLFSACFTFPATQSGLKFYAWITNEDKRWKQSGQFSIQDGIVTICNDEVVFDKGYNGDQVISYFCLVRDSSNLRILRYSFPHCSIKGGIQPGETFFCDSKSNIESVPFPCDLCEHQRYKTLAVDANNRLWICSEPIKSLSARPTVTIEDSVIGIKVAMFHHYRPIHFSDTLQVIKVKRRLKVAALYYGVEDADTIFPFKRISKRNFEAPVLNYPHMLVFETIGARRFGMNPDAIPKRFHPRKERWLRKVKRF